MFAPCEHRSVENVISFRVLAITSAAVCSYRPPFISNQEIPVERSVHVLRTSCACSKNFQKRKHLSNVKSTEIKIIGRVYRNIVRGKKVHLKLMLKYAEPQYPNP